MQSTTVAAWILIIVAVVVLFMVGKCSMSCPNLQRDSFDTYGNYDAYVAPATTTDVVYIDADPQLFQPLEAAQPLATSYVATAPTVYPSMIAPSAAYAAIGCSSNLTSGVPLNYY